MTVRRDRYVKVAVPSPLRRLFDYLPPSGIPVSQLRPGLRVRVSFGRRDVVGMIVTLSPDTNVPKNRLKKISALLDDDPVIDRQHLEFLLWASHYYQHPPGEVILNSLPALLRKGRPVEYPGMEIWMVTDAGADHPVDTLDRSPRQKALLGLLQSCHAGLTPDEIKKHTDFSRTALKALLEKGLVRRGIREPVTNDNPAGDEINCLTPEQAEAVRTVTAVPDRYQCFLLNGVTGSGKTEIYIRLIRAAVHSGRQALVLVPEIALTPQFIQRLETGVSTGMAVYHSGLSDRERFATWLRGRDGTAKVILGTRSAIWIPLSSPGLFIVDEEHDPSYKQQEGFRYSARDLALVRAKNARCPVILGSATPSLESIHNLARRDYREIRLPRRVGDAVMPEIRLIDMKSATLDGILSRALHDHIAETLKKHQQVLVFQNRRGYAPAVMCHDCGWLAMCTRCDKAMTLHKKKNRLWCHHCDRQITLPDTCPECSRSQLMEIGHGTERIEESLQTAYPGAKIVRIDRDTTRRKGSMDTMVGEILAGEADILIGTQMLAKGHHFPDVTLAVIADIDSSLYSTDFRAVERMGQLITQVSGRAGRGQYPGTVLIQTHFPDHPLIRKLLDAGYTAFTRALLEEREAAGLPPFSYMAVLRAEGHSKEAVGSFLASARDRAGATAKSLQIIGPVHAPMQRRAGRYRMQLIVQSTSRRTLSGFLGPWLDRVEDLKQSHKVRWSIDVDPQDMM